MPDEGRGTAVHSMNFWDGKFRPGMRNDNDDLNFEFLTCNFCCLGDSHGREIDETALF